MLPPAKVRPSRVALEVMRFTESGAEVAGKVGAWVPCVGHGRVLRIGMPGDVVVAAVVPVVVDLLRSTDSGVRVAGRVVVFVGRDGAARGKTNIERTPKIAVEHCNSTALLTLAIAILGPAN